MTGFVQRSPKKESHEEGPNMKKDLMEILACPVCKGSLDLTIGKEDGEDIVTGSLFCGQCNEAYPIEESIPNLLPPELR